MDSQMEWTLETYRLDELERKFTFPCVVCVNEGYYSETDAEGFSQGDIMSIDSKIILHKVAANFTFEEKQSRCDDPNYVEIENEILVPLNYKGKLKVIRHIKNYENVRELANEFPKYAKVTENLTVRTEAKVPVTIKAGSIIELDRIIPGSVRGTNKDPDRLIIQFEHKRGSLVVGVPFDVQGKFRTVPDNNEYTIREAIDRYSLPQHVKFVDDEIKRIYTQDLIEGIENMKTITISETLRLNRLVTQNVLVGHYKPLEGTETKDTGRFRQRTLVVLPVDNPEIRDIEVNVLQGVTDDIYEQVFLVRNVSNNSVGDIVDGSLYVDFAMASGIKIISHEDSQLEDDEKAPPRPPKPGFLSASAAQKKPKIAPKPSWKHSKKPPQKNSDHGSDLKHSKKPEEKTTGPESDLKHLKKPEEKTTGPKSDLKHSKKPEEKTTGPESGLKHSKKPEEKTTGPESDLKHSKKPEETTSGPESDLKHSKKPEETTTGPESDLKHSKKPEEKDSDSDDLYIIPEVDSKMSLERKKKEHKVVTKQKSSLQRVSVTSLEDTGDYEVPDNPISSPTTDEYEGFSLADMNFSSIGSGKGSLGKKSLMSNIKSIKSTLQKGFKASKGKLSKDKSSTEKTEPSIAAESPQLACQISVEVNEEEPGLYAEVDEEKMIDLPLPKPRQLSKQQKPTAFVHPSSMPPTARQKKFKDLDNKELVSRLNLCGLSDFANFCQNEKLNGKFFQNMAAEILEKNMNLKGIQLAKFIQMRDENWIPS